MAEVWRALAFVVVAVVIFPTINHLSAPGGQQSLHLALETPLLREDLQL